MTTTLSDLSSFEIARRLKCGFFGDSNPIDHDGTFYDVRDWTEYGYASCVAFTRLPDEGNGAALLVECGTINRPSTEAELEQSGDRIGRTPEVEIECVLAHWGFDVTEDFGGPYTQLFHPDGDGNIDEDTVWESVAEWLSGLGEA